MPSLNGHNQHDPFVSQLMTQMNRIEGKVDGMQTALLTIAKTEERVTRLMESEGKKTDWILKLQERIAELEKSDISMKAISTRLERAAWIIITALLTLFVGWLITNGVA